MNDTISFTSQPMISTDYHTPVEQPEVPVEYSPQPEETAAEPCPNLYAYVKELPSIQNPEGSNDIFFDIILNVSCEGKSATIIKKLKMCKKSLYQELLNSCQQPVTYVESKTEDKSDLKRYRELAGISHPKNYV
jgi:hypothetical protein